MAIKPRNPDVKPKAVKGIYGLEMFDTCYKMFSMLQSGFDVANIITHRLPVARF